MRSLPSSDSFRAAGRWHPRQGRPGTRGGHAAMASAGDGPGCVNSRLALGVLTPAGVGIEDRGMEHPPKSNEAADTVLAWFGLALSVMLLIVGIDMNRDGEWSVLVLGAL